MDNSTMNIEKSKLKFQNENITYDEAYTLNGCPVVETEQIIDIISSVLTEIIQEMETAQVQPYNTSFNGKQVPSISIKDYLMRISKCSHCSQECFILALIYIDRITEKNKTFTLHNLNIHRLLITSIMMAAKYYDDRYYNNEYYAKVGGISNNEINSLEREFLHYLNFKLYVSPVLFYKYRERLLISSEQINQQTPIVNEERINQEKIQSYIQ